MVKVVHDFKVMTELPAGWFASVVNASYGFTPEGLVISPVPDIYHHVAIDQIPVGANKTVRLVFKTPPVHIFSIGWMASGVHVDVAHFGLRVEEDGKMYAWAGESGKEGGEPVDLPNVKSVYVEKPADGKVKVVIEYPDRRVGYTLEMPATPYGMVPDLAGFYVYVTSTVTLDSFEVYSESLDELFPPPVPPVAWIVIALVAVAIVGVLIYFATRARV